MLENEDQFVPRTVERAHTAVGLAPNAQILELRIDRLAGREHLAEMTPVHAHIVDRAIAAMLGKVSKRFPQKIRIGPLGHLARGHDELSMARLASAADVAADRHVVGRVGENQPGLLPAQQQLERRRIPGVGAQQPVGPQAPQVADARNRRRVVDSGQLVGWIRLFARPRLIE